MDTRGNVDDGNGRIEGNEERIDLGAPAPAVKRRHDAWPDVHEIVDFDLTCVQLAGLRSNEPAVAPEKVQREQDTRVSFFLGTDLATTEPVEQNGNGNAPTPQDERLHSKSRTLPDTRRQE